MNVRLRGLRIVGGGYGSLAVGNGPFGAVPQVVSYGDATSDITALQAAILHYGAIWGVPLADMAAPAPPSPVLGSATLANLAACFLDAAKRNPTAKSSDGYTYAIYAGFTPLSVSQNLAAITSVLSAAATSPPPAATSPPPAAPGAPPPTPPAIPAVPINKVDASSTPASSIPWKWLAVGAGAAVVVGGVALLARRKRAGGLAGVSLVRAYIVYRTRDGALKAKRYRGEATYDQIVAEDGHPRDRIVVRSYSASTAKAYAAPLLK